MLKRMQPNHPRTPQQDRSIATKGQLFRAALELFGEEGYHHTTTKKIAARAGIAVGSFYAYYRNKMAVFLEVIRHYYGRISQEALGGLSGQILPAEGELQGGAGGDPHAFLSLLIDRLYEAHDISPQLHREITGMRYSDPEVDRLIRGEEEKTIAHVRELLESMRPALAVEDPEAAAHLVHRCAEELIHSIKIFGPHIEAERLLTELKHMLSRYLFGHDRP